MFRAASQSDIRHSENSVESVRAAGIFHDGFSTKRTQIRAALPVSTAQSVRVASEWLCVARLLQERMR